MVGLFPLFPLCQFNTMGFDFTGCRNSTSGNFNNRGLCQDKGFYLTTWIHAYSELSVFLFFKAFSYIQFYIACFYLGIDMIKLALASLITWIIFFLPSWPHFLPERRRQGKFQPFRRLFGKKKRREAERGFEGSELKPSHSTEDVCNGGVSVNLDDDPYLR